MSDEDVGARRHPGAGIPKSKGDAMKTDQEKAEELLRKRRLAAKGLKERGDGKPVDPLEGMDSLDPDDKHREADPLKKPEANTAAAIALGRAR